MLMEKYLNRDWGPSVEFGAHFRASGAVFIALKLPTVQVQVCVLRTFCRSLSGGHEKVTYFRGPASHHKFVVQKRGLEPKSCMFCHLSIEWDLQIPRHEKSATKNVILFSSKRTLDAKSLFVVYWERCSKSICHCFEAQKGIFSGRHCPTVFTRLQVVVARTKREQDWKLVSCKRLKKNTTKFQRKIVLKNDQNASKQVKK